MKLLKPLLLTLLVLMVPEIKAMAIPIPVINNSFEDGTRSNLSTNCDWGYVLR